MTGENLIDTLEAADGAWILDIWEHPTGRMCMAVRRSLGGAHSGRITDFLGQTDGEARPDAPPAYYTGYVQTTLTTDGLANDPWYRDHINVSGGLTYGPDGDGWVGFDYLHAFDLCVDEEGDPLPGNIYVRMGHGLDSVRLNRVSPQDVKDECAALAEQLDAIEQRNSESTQEETER